MNARPTIPIPPWEIPDPTGETRDKAPAEGMISAARPARQPAEMLVGRAFQGRLNVSDLDYMARAILQLCDENHELRERVRRLEKRLGK